MDESTAEARDPPEKHSETKSATRIRHARSHSQCWNVSARLELLEQHIADWFEDSEAHKEDGERGVVLPVGHFEIFLKAGNFRISDICPVEEGNQVQQTQPWYEMEVELPE